MHRPGKETTPMTLPEMAAALRTTLHLGSGAVGVKILVTDADFADCSFSEPQVAVHYCSAVKMATEGTSLKLGRNDLSCDTAPRILGLEKGFMDSDFVGSYVSGGLYDNHDRAEEVLSGVVTLDSTTGIALGPLEAFSDEMLPDVVIVSILPYGTMRLAQAASFNGTSVKSNVIGMHGICSESTAAPFTGGEVCTSLLCSGTRHIAGWDEQLMSAGIPFERLPEILHGLAATAERYEPDERKAEMRSCCSRVGASSHLAEKIDNLSDRSAYFYQK